MLTKSKLKLISVALAITSSPLVVAIAQGTTPPDQPLDIPALINRAMNWALGLLVALAGAFILYAAFLYLTGSGNEAKVTKAKNVIIYAVVALVVGFVAKGIVALVISLLQG